MCGYAVPADEINFEWPTKEMILSLPEDIELNALEFKSHGGGLSSVCCVLSNGLVSPVYQNFANSHDKNEILSLKDKNIKSV